MSFRQSVGDFFAPFFRVRFLNVNEISGAEVYGADGEASQSTEVVQAAAEFLTVGETTSFSISENEQMSQLRSYATTFTVETSGGDMTKATFHCEPMYEDALKIIDNPTIQWNSLMVAEWGYIDTQAGFTSENKYSKTGIFIINKPTLAFSESGVVIEIFGTDLLSQTLIKTDTRRKWDRKQYKTDLDILTEIVKRNGMEIDTSGLGLGLGGLPGLEDYQHPLEVEHPIKGEPEALEQFDSDMSFFRQIVRSNNCTFYVQGKRVFLVDWDSVKGSEANYRLLMYQQPREDYDIPMESFSTNALPILFWPPEAKGTKAATTDPDTNEVKDATDPEKAEPEVYDTAADPDHKAQGTKVTTGRKEPGQGRQLDTDAGTVTPNPTPEDNQAGKQFYVPWGTPNRAETAKQPAKEKSLVANITAEATIPGTPALETMQIVEVRGVGNHLSGYYLVKKAIHTISTGGYQTQLQLVREAASDDPVGGTGVQPASQANPDSPQGGAGDLVSADTSQVT